MQGKEKLIDDILSAARRTAAAMIEEANAECEASLSALAKELENSRSSAAAEAERAANDMYSGKIKLCELEAGKIMLEARQNCVAEVYDSVKKKILGAPDKEYLEFLKAVVSPVLSDGDEIVAAKADEKRVTAEFVKKLSAATGKKITLAKERGDFDGGVILRSSTYDRNLTADEIISDLKERTVSETVKRLGLF